MFDPRTLPGNDLAPSIGIVVVYISLLADLLTTRYGIWYKGLKESNKLMEKLTKTAFGSFIDGLIRLALVGLLDVGLLKAGYLTNQYAYVPYLFSIPGFALAIRNYLKARKLPTKTS